MVLSTQTHNNKGCFLYSVLCKKLEAGAEARWGGGIWWLRGCKCVINGYCIIIIIIVPNWPSPSPLMSSPPLCTADEVNFETGNVNIWLGARHWSKLACHWWVFFIKSLTCASVCGYWLEPNVSCAGSGFIRSCCYWKWIPWAIWIQLIQLNTVNNWSDSETEPCHMGAVTSSFVGLKPYSCAAGLPRVVCSTISPLYLITACEGHKADHEHRMGGYTSIIVLRKSLQWQKTRW